MTSPSDLSSRRSIRLRNYDYSQPGAYFVTICIETRACILGEVVGAEVHRSPAGDMADSWWRELPHKYPHLQLDERVVMPNHVHGILLLIEDWDAGGRPHRAAPTGSSDSHPGNGLRATVGDVVGWYKAQTTNAYIDGVKELNWPRFPGRLWQRDYYEHIIRDEEELQRAREYIALNPARWTEDHNHPDNLIP